MATPPNPKSWENLLARARAAAAPDDLDVRHRILAEISRAAPNLEPAWSDAFVLITRLLPVRVVLGGFAAVTLLALWNGFGSGDDLGTLAALQDILYVGL